MNELEDNVCQCCLSSSQLIDIKSYCDDLKLTYIELQEICFSYKVIYTNKESAYICTSCILKLKDVYDFKLCVEKSRNILLSRSHKRKQKDKKSSITIKSNRKRKKIKKDTIDYTDTNEQFETANDDNFICDVCKETVEQYNSLVDPHCVCEVCGKLCSTRRALFFHKKTHSNSRYDCKECGKLFKTQRNLRVHKNTKHLGESLKYKCKDCDEVFMTYNARVKHCVEKHGKEDKQYKCAQCTKRYRLGSQLSAHVRSKHLQEKNHSCNQCNSAFFSKASLRKHLLTHESIQTTDAHENLIKKEISN